MKNSRAMIFVAMIAAVIMAAGGCATVPMGPGGTATMGPTVTVMPGPNKPFDVFQQEDRACRDFALNSIGGPAAIANVQNAAIGNTVLGTVLGAGAGVLIGAAGGDAGTGAAIGAGTGLLGGAAVGANTAANSMAVLQERYNTAYEQCMYAKGNQIPGEQAPPSASPPPPPSPR